MKITFEDLRKFNQVTANLFARKSVYRESKLGYAIKRFTDINLIKIFNEYNNELEMARIDHCLADPITKAVMLASGGSQRMYQYSKEGLKAVLKAELDLIEKWDKKEFEVKPWICLEPPKDLTEEEMETMKRLVI